MSISNPFAKSNNNISKNSNSINNDYNSSSLNNIPSQKNLPPKAHTSNLQKSNDQPPKKQSKYKTI